MKDEESDRYIKWQERVAKDLPSLCNRVFKLRNITYLGCGFHYELEYSLGAVIQRVSKFTLSDRDIHNRMISKVIVNHLYAQLSKIEKELKDE